LYTGSYPAAGHLAARQITVVFIAGIINRSKKLPVMTGAVWQLCINEEILFSCRREDMNKKQLTEIITGLSQSVLFIFIGEIFAFYIADVLLNGSVYLFI